MLHLPLRQNWSSHSNPNPSVTEKPESEVDDTPETSKNTLYLNKRRRRSISASPVVSFSTVIVDYEDAPENFISSGASASSVEENEELTEEEDLVKDDENAIDETNDEEELTDYDSEDESGLSHSAEIPVKTMAKAKVSENFEMKLEQEIKKLQRELQVRDSGNETDGQNSNKKRDTDPSKDVDESDEELTSDEESELESSFASNNEDAYESDADVENSEDESERDNSIDISNRHGSSLASYTPVNDKSVTKARRKKTPRPIVILEKDLDPERTYTEKDVIEQVIASTKIVAPEVKKIKTTKSVPTTPVTKELSDFEKYVERSKSDTRVVEAEAKKSKATTSEIINVTKPEPNDDNTNDSDDGNYQCIKIEVEPASTINNSEDDECFEHEKSSKSPEEIISALYDEALKEEAENKASKGKAPEDDVAEHFSNTLDDMLIQVRATKDKYKKKADAVSLFSQDSFKVKYMYYIFEMH